MSLLRVWHCPQVPMRPFFVTVDSLEEAIKVLDILADYDLFQYENKVKPDYCSAQGLEEYDPVDEEWYEWHSKDDMNIREYKDRLEPKHL